MKLLKPNSLNQALVSKIYTRIVFLSYRERLQSHKDVFEIPMGHLNLHTFVVASIISCGINKTMALLYVLYCIDGVVIAARCTASFSGSIVLPRI